MNAEHPKLEEQKMRCPFNNSDCLCADCGSRMCCEEGCKDCIEENEYVKETYLCTMFKGVQKQKEEEL